MSLRPHGKARVNPSNLDAFARCDRCYDLVNHSDLQPQMRYAGANLVNMGLLVCGSCLDIPNQQERTIVLPPDPVPIMNARPEPFAPTGVSREETQEFYSESLNAVMVTEQGAIIVPEGTNYGN